MRERCNAPRDEANWIYMSRVVPIVDRTKHRKHIFALIETRYSFRRCPFPSVIISKRDQQSSMQIAHEYPSCQRLARKTTVRFLQFPSPLFLPNIFDLPLHVQAPQYFLPGSQFAD